VAEILERDGYTVYVVQNPLTSFDADVVASAFQPDLGEPAGALQNKTPPAATSIGPVGGGFLAIKQEAFRQDFAAGLSESVAHFMSISQVPIAGSSFEAKDTATAWSKKPSYAVVSTQDRMINPELERFMSRRAKSETIALPRSHVTFLAHPKEGRGADRKGRQSGRIGDHSERGLQHQVACRFPAPDPVVVR
jgi:hypothetical protein